MVAPIDYTLNVQSPFEAAVQGFQFGRGIQQAKRQDADYARQQFDLLDAEKKNAALSFGYQTLGAIESGNIPLAKQMLTERATAFRNAGDELQAKSYEDAAAAAEMNPAWAKTTIDYMMRSLDPEYDSRMAKLRGGEGTTDYRFEFDVIKRRLVAEGVPEAEAEFRAQQEMATRSTEQRKELSRQGFTQEQALALLQDKIKRGQMITEKDLELIYGPKIEGEKERARVLASEGAKREFAAPTDITGAENLVEQLEETRKVAERAITQADWTTTGGLGKFLSWIPGTDSYDLDKTLLTVKANLGLDTLVSLKNQGGTLGAVSEKELDLLLSKVASLDQAQSDAQFKSQLNEVLKMYDRTIKNIQKDLRVKYSKQKPAASVTPAPAAATNPVSGIPPPPPGAVRPRQ